MAGKTRKVMTVLDKRVAEAGEKDVPKALTDHNRGRCSKNCAPLKRKRGNKDTS